MNRIRHVAVIVETSLAHGRGILKGVARFVAAREPWSLYVDQRGLTDAPPAWLQEWNGDGLIVRASTPRMIELIKKLDVPVVDTMGSNATHGLPTVYSDDHQAMTLAAQHLLNRQFRNFAFVGVVRAAWSRARRDSLVKILAQAGHECPVYSPLSRRRFSESWEGGQNDLALWIDSLPKPVGIVAAHDLRALCVLDACRRKSLHVPEQVAVIGLDNDETLCDLGDPPLSSVQLDCESIGYNAASLLSRLMNGEAVDVTKPITVAPLGVVTRRSTEIVAVDDQATAAALRFIYLHAHDSIGVEDVARHCGVSRRVIERNFAKFLRGTPNEFIIKARMTKAKELIRATQLSLDDIATKCGLSSAAYLNVLFHKHFGMTPGQFRDGNRLAKSE